MAKRTCYVILLTERRSWGLPIRAVSNRCRGDKLITTESEHKAAKFTTKKSANEFLALLGPSKRWVYTVFPA